MWKVPEQYRITNEVCNKIKNIFNINPVMVNSWVSDYRAGPRGYFMLPNPKNNKGLFILCMASDTMGWDHVIATIPSENRFPTKAEMNFVRSLFWDAEDIVVEFHIPNLKSKKDEFCLHLWRNQKNEIKTPPASLAGTN